MGDVYAYESAGRGGMLYIADLPSKQATIEEITPEMIGTTQHFKFKPMGSITATFVGADNKPMVNTRISLGYKHPRPSTVLYGGGWTFTYAETDTEGRATLPVLSGKTTVTLNVPYSLSEQARRRHGIGTNFSIDKELDLAPGENLDIGTIKLIRVFGKMPEGMENIQINGMNAPDSPRMNDREMVTILWADENGEYDVLLPLGHYRFSGLDFTLSLNEESKDIQLNFDADKKGHIVR
jgi:hypothetical protein